MTSNPTFQPGSVYAYWTLLERVPSSPQYRETRWLCRYVCGLEKLVTQSNLKYGKSRGCGCELVGQATKTHGYGGTPLYGAWRNMMDRCYREGNRQYHNYGGRGIDVHQAWHEFESFAADMGPHPGPGLTLDRIDNDQGYKPGNVRWATRGEQARNKRGVHLAEFKGKTQCLTDWAMELGVGASHLYRRVRSGMTEQQAIQDLLDSPPKVRGPYKKRRITP